MITLESLGYELLYDEEVYKKYRKENGYITFFKGCKQVELSGIESLTYEEVEAIHNEII